MAERVGIYVCHCGSNIAGMVDVEEVARWAGKHLKDVVVAKEAATAFEVRPMAGQAVLEVDLPAADSLYESYLAIYTTKERRLITLLELLSPTNKTNPNGRRQYEEKRRQVLATQPSRRRRGSQCQSNHRGRDGCSRCLCR
mgnify:CR=1 FL=1